MKLEFIVRTSNPNFCVLHGGGRAIDGVYSLGEGLDAHIVSETEVSSGISVNELAVGFMIGITSGIPSGIVANRIYDYLMDNGNNEIIVQEEQITILNKDELVQYIERTYRKNDK